MWGGTWGLSLKSVVKRQISKSRRTCARTDTQRWRSPQLNLGLLSVWFVCFLNISPQRERSRKAKRASLVIYNYHIISHGTTRTQHWERDIWRFESETCRTSRKTQLRALVQYKRHNVRITVFITSVANTKSNCACVFETRDIGVDPVMIW